MRKIFLILLMLLPALGSAKDSVLPLPDPYGKVLRRYSRRGESYSFQDMQAKIIWWATYASDEFRDAFRTEYDRVYPQGQDARAKERSKPWITPDPQATFMVGIYALKREMSDLDSEKSLQDLSLEVDGHFYKPKLIEKIPTTQFEIYFFNYLNLWFKTYRVVFPFEGLHNRDVAFKLHLHGVAGGSALKFKAK